MLGRVSKEKQSKSDPVVFNQQVVLSAHVSVGQFDWGASFIDFVRSGRARLWAAYFVSTLRFIFMFDRPAPPTPSLILCKTVQMSHLAVSGSPFSPWKTFKLIYCQALKQLLNCHFTFNTSFLTGPEQLEIN